MCPPRPFITSRNAHRPTDLTPPAPLSSSALLRNAAWRGGSQKRNSFRLPLSTSGGAAKLERGLGGEVGAKRFG